MPCAHCGLAIRPHMHMAQCLPFACGSLNALGGAIVLRSCKTRACFLWCHLIMAVDFGVWSVLLQELQER